MFRNSFIILFALVVFPMTDAKALSDAEYKILMQSPQFKKADQKLTESWYGLYPSLSKEDRKFVMNQQRDWLRKERDIKAHKLQTLGISKVDAYTINLMNEVGKEFPRADNYYDGDMTREALQAIKEAGGDSNFLTKTLEIDLSIDRE